MICIEFMMEELMLTVFFVLLFTCVVFVIVRWLLLARMALEKGRIRIESMEYLVAEGRDNGDMDNRAIKYDFLK